MSELNNSSCSELNNIKYKNMILNGVGITNKISPNIDPSSLDSILLKESNNNKNESWNKLDKTQKITKLNEYAVNLIHTHSLTKTETQQLRLCLSMGLERSRLAHVKDVNYNTSTGKIISIPYLTFESTNRKFTIKRNDRRSSVLKSLGPGRTRKKLEKIDSDIKDK
tara:strand:+ start:2833 stop:3333 length:501 start_codon:yes stop_codon:yes gene_type:complete